MHKDIFSAQAITSQLSMRFSALTHMTNKTHPHTNRCANSDSEAGGDSTVVEEGDYYVACIFRCGCFVCRCSSTIFDMCLQPTAALRFPRTARWHELKVNILQRTNTHVLYASTKVVNRNTVETGLETRSKLPL